jgi:hypothetical protein
LPRAVSDSEKTTLTLAFPASFSWPELTLRRVCAGDADSEEYHAYTWFLQSPPDSFFADRRDGGL